MTDPHRWTRPRLLLALLLAALVAGAIPLRAPRRDKAPGTSAWRAAAARPAAARPDLELRGSPPLPAAAPEGLPLPVVRRAAEPAARRSTPPAPGVARSPLPRAPPFA